MEDSQVDTSKYKDFGTANGWRGIPVQVSNCTNIHKHTKKERKIGNCWHEVRCDICKWRYDYDSSG